MGEVSFVQLSDTHILPSPEARLHDVDTADQLRRVVDTVLALETRPAFVVLSGDLANEGDEESYRRLNDLLAPLAEDGLTLLFGMGNHDARAPFRRALLADVSTLDDGAPLFYSRTFGELRIIVLDTAVPGCEHGDLDQAQLTWLADELASPAPDGDVIVMHHLPMGRTVTKQDELEQFSAFRAGEALAAVLRGKRVAGILGGHWHAATMGVWQGIVTAAAPATAFLGDPGQRHGWRFHGGAGFNLCTVRDGSLFVSPVIVDGSAPRWETSWSEIAQLLAARAR
jgi:3',5'-cyclic-AMP phosphodiesterase